MGHRFVFISVFLLFVGASGLSEVYEGGSYSEDKVSAPLGSTGGRAGYALPYEVNYADDREKNAVAERAVYVFDANNICYKGKFSETGTDKELIVFSQTAFPASHCIYQKKFNREPAGFSIFTEDGGICMPTSSVTSVKDLNADPKNNLEVIRHRVSFRYCMGQTISYGEYVDQNSAEQGIRVARSVEEKPEKRVKAKNSNDKTDKTVAVTGPPEVSKPKKSQNQDAPQEK